MAQGRAICLVSTSGTPALGDDAGTAHAAIHHVPGGAAAGAGVTLCGEADVAANEQGKLNSGPLFAKVADAPAILSELLKELPAGEDLMEARIISGNGRNLAVGVVLELY